MSARVYSHKSTEHEGEDSKRITFVSYVDEQTCNSDPNKCNEKSDQSSSGLVTVKNANKATQILTANENPQRAADEMDLQDTPIEMAVISKSTHGKSKPKPRLSSRNFSNAKICPELSKLRSASTESVKEMHPKQYKINKEIYDGEKEAKSNRPYYSNLDQLVEKDEIYSIPQSPNGGQVMSFSHTIHEEASSCPTYEGRTDVKNAESFCTKQQQTKSKSKASKNDDDYLQMSGCFETLISQENHINYSAAEPSSSEYENIKQASNTSINFTTSVEPSPFVRAMYKQSSDEIVNITNADNVDESEYIDPDGVEAARAKGPVSAKVPPYTPETVTPTVIIRPKTRPFILYTVEEVVECFEECALPQLAGICRDENLDGDYFRDTSNEDLAQEPFSLDSFYISKVRKVIAGWRPRRRSTFK